LGFRSPAVCASYAREGTTCNFSIGNDLFTTFFTAQMGRGKLQWGVCSSGCRFAANGLCVCLLLQDLPFLAFQKKREFFCFSPRTKGSKTGFHGNFQIACFPYGNAENMFEVLFFSQLRGFIFFFRKKRRRGV
jgi:hypothetical protein